MYSFEKYTLDTNRRELRGGTSIIPLQPQVFDLLEYLIRNRDRVITKDNLIGAIWGGRIVSESALTARINAARIAIGDSGEAQRLIRTLRRKGLRFVGAVKEEPRQGGTQAKETASMQSTGAVLPNSACPRPDKPSIAVLPFENMSNDPQQDYFADGVVEEIITALSRIRWLVVTARTSSFQFKGVKLDVREVARRLEVRYVLEGSVRKSGGRIRITNQLIDAATGLHLWAERYDGRLEDIFDLEDEITRSVISAIEPSVRQAEIERALRKRPENLDAYDYYLRALQHCWKSTREDAAEGTRLIEQSLSIDPTYAPACALAVRFYFIRLTCNWTDCPEQEAANGIRLARAALDLNHDDAFVLTHAGWGLATLAGDLDAGAAAIERGARLNPNSAQIVNTSGYVLTLLGDQEAALKRFTTALHLNPSDPLAYKFLTGAGIASLLMGHFDAALAYCEEARRRHQKWGPTFRILAAAYAHLGQVKKSAEALARYLALDPGVTVSHLRRQLPYRDAEQADRLWEGLRRAGLPE